MKKDAKTVRRLHLICKRGENWDPLSKPSPPTGPWRTGAWSGIGDELADALIGKQICLHHSQKERAWHGGTIIAWEPMERDGSAKKKNGKAFIYVAGEEGALHLMCHARWGREKALVYDEP